MLIVKIKVPATIETQEKVRERIKEQIKEDLIIHDDSIEITFADDVCTECGSTNLEEIETKDVEGVVFSRVIKCNACGKLREGAL